MKQEDFDRALRINVPSFLTQFGVQFSTENDSFREKDNRSVVWHPPHSNRYGMWIYNDFSSNRMTSSGSIMKYLAEYHGYTKTHALQLLAEFDGISFGEEPSKTNASPRTNSPPTPTNAPVERKPFKLPDRNVGEKKDARVIAYLLAREIDKEVIFTCVNKGLVYQSKDHGNAVFVGRDSKGIARHAALRGTSTLGGERPFRGESPSSDPKFTFCIPARFSQVSPTHKETLYITESPIDAMSIATIMNINQGSAWRNGKHFLGLCGVQKTDSALQYLHDHPSISHVVIALDNDRAGRETTAKLQELLAGKSIAILNYDGDVKDPNEFLMKHKNKLIDQQQGKERKNYGRENTNSSNQTGKEPRRNDRRREH